MLVLEDGFGGYTAAAPGWFDRLAAKLLPSRIDCALASGVSPDSSPRLSLRARRLTSMSTRRALVRATGQLIAAATGPTRRTGPTVLVRRPIVDTIEEWDALTDRLLRPGPVAAAGVARFSALLSAAWSSAYRTLPSSQLREALRDARAALDAFDTPGFPVTDPSWGCPTPPR